MASIVLALGCTVLTSGRSADASALTSRPLYGRGTTLTSVSCTDATDCTAVGYVNVGEPIYATEIGGVWGAATVIQMPPGLGGARPLGVSCSSKENCTAVGATGQVAGFHATEAGGVWGALTVSTSVGAADLVSVSCTSTKDCTAVGDDRGKPIYETETAGSWGATSVVASPGGSGLFQGVSCASPEDCTAVGYDANVGEPIYATEVGGVWGAATGVSAPPGSLFTAVSCTSATNCTAVGQDVTGVAPAYSFQPIYATETTGVWGATTLVSISGDFGSVSCTDTSDCTAVGEGNDQPIHETEVSGVWGAPTAVFSPLGGGSFLGVSCASATDCTAVGVDGYGFATYPTEKAGVWPKVPAAPRYVKVTAGNRWVRVAWTAPASDGRPPVTGYTVSFDASTHSYACTTSQRSCTFHGLTNGKTYVTSIYARNPAGSSASSAKKSVKPRA